MLKLFRRLRQRLLVQGRFRAYLLYALGEVVLIVFGILLALQLSNWNARRTHDQAFSVLLEQIYNAIWTDTEMHDLAIDALESQVTILQQLLAQPDTFPEEQISTILYYLDLSMDDQFFTKGRDLLPFLDYQSADPRQRDLIREITSYSQSNLYQYAASEYGAREPELLEPALRAAGIPEPALLFGVTDYWGFHFPNEAGFFSASHAESARQLLREPSFRSQLQSLLSHKMNVLSIADNAREDAFSILDRIKAYQPEVRLLYDDLGILGSGLPDGYDRSVPMQRMSGPGNRWEVELELQVGTFKFRNRDSWNQNWGGVGFPEGRSVYLGRDIWVPTAGRYHILLDLEKRRYQFTLLDE
ncbi:MAG: hypothetical protein KDC54_13115 [Lewinella sp.]|nr:hypothetical protein [Lewinella sp.]